MEVDRTRTRRERTFIGSECAVCEEPLEHTLRGERVLQFSCSHVSHEACFYEYIREFESQYCPTCNAPLGLDTSRGGNVLDIGSYLLCGWEKRNLPPNFKINNEFNARETGGANQFTRATEKISNIVRSVTMSDTATTRSGLTTPTQWEQQSSRRPPSDSASRFNNRDPSFSAHRDSRDIRDTNSQRERVERLTTASHPRPPHSRNGSAAGSSGDYHEGQHTSSGRRHDYDVQAMESDLSPRPGVTKNPIPAPIVTVRSEFPTMNRSRQQQSLTCLITVEVPEGNWRPNADDLRHGPASLEQLDEPFSARFGGSQDARSIQLEPTENLDDVAEELKNRVDNWHGLEFNR